MLGRSLGNYGVVSKIGEGGMGVVYLAQHVTLGKKAAIKVLRPALSSNQDIVSRFFNEARAVTAVRNPGIVDVYDFGFLEDRTAYIIMEYLEGESLAARLRRNRPAIPWTLTVVRAIARALQAAHEHGIVHRDLKPDNVFLVPDADLPAGERVKLLDFGIAKLTHGVGDASHTTTGTVMGTPTYMAPEQCRGAGAVDQRADLYSLGCVAYEMLCGQPPFVADGPGDVIARHLYFEPQPPRSRRAEIPDELEAIVLRLLKKEPRARYSTAADLVRAIDQLSVAPAPGAAPSKPLATEFVATIPVVRDTTLNGAASSQVTIRKEEPPSRRLAIIAAAVTVAIAAFAIVWVFGRGGHVVDAASNATAARVIEPSSSSEIDPAHGSPTAVIPAPAAPSPATPVPKPAPASVPATPPAPAAPPTDQAHGAVAGPPGEATGDAASQSAPVLRAAPRAQDAKLDGASGDARGGPVRPVDVTADKAETTTEPAPPATKRDPPSAHEVPRAAGVKTKPRSTGKPTASSESRSPDEFPKWTESLNPGNPASSPGPVKPQEPMAGAGTAPGEAVKPSEAGSSAGTAPGRTMSSNPTHDPPDAGCTPAGFESVLGSKAPNRKAVNDARSRLTKCRPSMDPDVYDDIYHRLIKRY
jgi:serine/threonine-protein kinase